MGMILSLLGSSIQLANSLAPLWIRAQVGAVAELVDAAYQAAGGDALHGWVADAGDDGFGKALGKKHFEGTAEEGPCRLRKRLDDAEIILFAGHIFVCLDQGGF